MLPKNIKIGYKEYKIEVCEEKLNSGDSLYGQIDYEKEIIYLRSCNTETQHKATLLHEVLHGISEMFGIELSEKTVEVLGNGLYTVCKDNGIQI